MCRLLLGCSRGGEHLDTAGAGLLAAMFRVQAPLATSMPALVPIRFVCEIGINFVVRYPCRTGKFCVGMLIKVAVFSPAMKEKRRLKRRRKPAYPILHNALYVWMKTVEQHNYWEYLKDEGYAGLSQLFPRTSKIFQKGG